MPIQVLAATALVLAVVVAAFGVSVAVGMALGWLGIDELEDIRQPQPVAPAIPPALRRDP